MTAAELDRGPVLFCAFLQLELALCSDVITLFRGFREFPVDDISRGSEPPDVSLYCSIAFKAAALRS